MKKVIAVMITLLLTTHAFSQLAPTTLGTAPTPATTPPGGIAQGFCPDIKKVQKNADKGNWEAQTPAGLWHSDGMSFATNLTLFTGAQWNGIKIGQITCVYGSQQRYIQAGVPQIQQTLPVLLMLQTLALKPTAGKWKHPAHGIRNCVSNDQNDCAFEVRVKPPSADIYQQVDAIKPAGSDGAN